MREYKEEYGIMQRVVHKVKCNMCGKELKIENGIVKEGCVHLDIPFEYFTNKDGEKHQIDLCENCYDSWVAQFKIPVTKEDMNELL
ncbi:MAG: hypothetical protein IKL78_04670 [Lachnospiraceae bacterium]|nr:hypothetical protein [Lachnospiraceae bacterium]